MKVNEALKCSETMPFDLSSNTLGREVKRLREQRELLYEAIPDDTLASEAVQCIIDEMFPKKKKTKMTVDQAISDVESCSGSTPQEEVLVNEVKRLRRIAEVRCMKIDQQDKKIEEKNKEIKRLHGDIETKERDIQLLRKDITTARRSEHESTNTWKENRKELGRLVRNVLKSYGV